jgi:hypothetical protein
MLLKAGVETFINYICGESRTDNKIVNQVICKTLVVCWYDRMPKIMTKLFDGTHQIRIMINDKQHWLKINFKWSLSRLMYFISICDVVVSKTILRHFFLFILYTRRFIFNRQKCASFDWMNFVRCQIEFGRRRLFKQTLVILNCQLTEAR